MARDNYLFTSESVSEGHPDKVCDRISDAVLDAFLAEEPEARVACETFATTNRVVIGADSERAARIMAELYEPFVRTGNPILQMDVASAELTKYAANAMLATRISFMNEIASLCSKVGASIDQVRRGIGSDERIGSRFLFAGVGYGGSCFPKDVKALIHTAADEELDFKILGAVEAVNEDQKRLLSRQIRAEFGEDLTGRRFAVWGLAFKPNTDDMREAPSLTIVPALVGGGATVRVVDPQGQREGAAMLAGVTWVDDAYDAAEGADAVVILTEWNEFRALDLKRLAQGMSAPRMADLRNIYSPAEVEKSGFTGYVSIGRQSLSDG